MSELKEEFDKVIIWLIQRMSEDRRLRGIPVVVVCYEDSSTPRDDLRQRGVQAFLPKPFTPEVLVSVLNQVMGE